MRPLASAPWLAVLAIGFLTAGCAVAGQGAPSESASPAPVGAVPVPVSPTPTARPTVSTLPGPEFSEARIPKEAQQGVPPEDAPVVFEEVGLANGQVISYQLAGDASASYQCWNPKSGAFGSQNWTVKRHVTSAATVTADASGMIRSILSLRLPAPEKSSCSTGFRAVAYAGRYDKVLLTDTTNDLRIDLDPYQFAAN